MSPPRLHLADRLAAAVADRLVVDRLVAAVAAVADCLVAAVVDHLVAAVVVLAVAAERRHCPAALASAERPTEFRAVGTPCTHSGRYRPRQRASCLRATPPRWAANARQVSSLTARSNSKYLDRISTWGAPTQGGTDTTEHDGVLPDSQSRGCLASRTTPVQPRARPGQGPSGVIE